MGSYLENILFVSFSCRKKGIHSTLVMESNPLERSEGSCTISHRMYDYVQMFVRPQMPAKGGLGLGGTNVAVDYGVADELSLEAGRENKTQYA